MPPSPQTALMKSDKQSGFIDIHSHFLPFLDDGAENYAQCLASARWYLSAGINQVIATPHFIPGTKWEPTPEQIGDSIQQAEKMLAEQNLPLKILPGMEIMLTENICRNFAPDRFLSLGGRGFYLIELPLDSGLSTPLAEGLQRLPLVENMHFVIAHPERCKVFTDNRGLLEQLVGQGILTQVNIDSVLGLAGQRVQQNALEFLQAGWVHFLASDTHARNGRMPPNKIQIAQLYDLLGKDATVHALQLNPQRLLTGKRVDPIIPDGNIRFLTQLYAQQGGYMQKLKKIFIRH